MPPKAAYVHTIVKKTQSPQFDLLPEPPKNPTTAHIDHRKELMSKYTTIFNVFSTNNKMMTDYKIDGSKIKGKKSDIKWVGTNHAKIREYLVDTYPDQSTLSSWFGWLANILLIINKHKYRDTVTELFLGSKNTKSVSNTEKKKSRLKPNDRANWIHFQDLVALREAMKIRRYKDRADKVLNIDYLVLCLNTMIPPTRLDWCKAEFYPRVMQTTNKPYGMKKGYMDIVESPVGKPGLQDIYYVYRHKKDEWAIFLNGENKIGAKRKEKGLEKFTIFLDTEITYDVLNDDGMPTGQKVPITKARELNSVITDSLKDFPRDYVLPSRNGTAMDASSYEASLFRSTQKKLHQNLLRDIYVYYFHKVRLMEYDTLETIALYMRHSVSQAIESYTKVNVPPYKPKTIDFPIVVEPVSTVKIVEIPRKPYFDPKEYGKKYRQGITKNEDGVEEVDTELKKARDKKRKDKYADPEHKEKMLARKTLFYLNRGLTKQPMEKTITKYGLKKGADGVWTSTKI